MWLLTSRQRIRCNKTEAEEVAGSSWWRIHLPRQTLSKALSEPARGTGHLLPEDNVLPLGMSCQARQTSGGRAHKRKNLPPSKTHLPSLNNVTKKSNNRWVIHFKSLSVLGGGGDDEIIRPGKKRRWHGWHCHKVTSSAKNTVNRGTRPSIRTNSSAITGSRGLTHHQAARCPSPGLLPTNPKTSGLAAHPPQQPLSPTPQMQVAQPPSWKVKFLFLTSRKASRTKQQTQKSQDGFSQRKTDIPH